jgi:N-acetylglucosaminyldiphosphoundecaprenol N-acetyl-beta-D-mannosaminyltransferase
MAIEALVFEEPAAAEHRLVEKGRVVELRRRRLELAGALVDQVDLNTAVERIRGFLRSGSAHHVMTINLDFLSIAQRDPRFRETINRADLAVADGMPLVWVSRLQGQPFAERIAGVELVNESCRVAAEMGRGVFLLGAAPGVAEAAGRRLEACYAGLRVVGAYSPPFRALTPEEDEEIVQMIREAAPGLLLVAFGAPRQDLWIRAHLASLNVPVAMGVGCVLDLLAGAARRAPGWMQQAGLEWSYRLIQEPRRLWRRYILDDIPMLGRLVLTSAREERPGRVVASEPAAERPV